MGPEYDLARKSRWVIAAVITAALAVTALALTGIAVLLGWAGPGDAPGDAPVVAAAPAPSAVVLVPGETLVEPPRAAPAAAPASARADPLMPEASQPTPPPPAPKTVPRLIERPIEAPAPEPPRVARWEHPSSPTDPWPQRAACDDCGEVVAIAVYPDLAEVRVRFEDGDTRVHRYRPPSPFRLGERVRLRNGRLFRD